MDAMFTGSVLVVAAVMVGCRSVPNDSINGMPVGQAAMSSDELSREALTNPLPLNLQSLVAAARQHNPEVVALRAAVDIARAQVLMPPVTQNPELRLAMGHGDQWTERTWRQWNGSLPVDNSWMPLGSIHRHDEESDETRISLRLFPPNPWLVRAARSGERARLAAAAADLQAAEWRAECQIAGMLATLRSLESELTIVNRQCELRRDHLKVIKALVQQQQATILDEADAEHGCLRAMDDAVRLERAIQAQREALSSFCCANLQEGRVEIDTLNFPSQLDSETMTVLRSRLLESRQDVLAAYWRYQSALAALREAKSRRIPWFTHVEGSIGHSVTRDRLGATADLSSGVNGVVPGDVVSVDSTKDVVWGIEAAVSLPVLGLMPNATRVQEAELRRCAEVMRDVARSALVEFDRARQGWISASARTESAVAALKSQEEKAAALMHKVEGRSDLGPESFYRLQEIRLQLQRSAVQIAQEKDLAFWKLKACAGRHLETTGM